MKSTKKIADIPNMLMNVSEQTKQRLRGFSTTYALSKKESLPVLQSPPSEIVFVQSGWLSITINDTTVSILKEGDVFTGPILPTGSESHSSVTLTAITPAAAILIKRMPLMVTLHERPDLLLSMYDQTCERLMRVYIQLARTQVDPLEVRLASFLWSLGMPREGGHRYIPTLSQSVVASCLGTAREEVSRKRQMLVQSDRLFKVGNDWFISEEVGRTLAARGYGE